jgi:hypothetical protein
MFSVNSIYFADNVVYYVGLVILVVTVVVELTAFVHCATRRADAFPVVGRLSKAMWVLMTGGAIAFTALSGYSTIVNSTGFLGPLTAIVACIALTVALVYLLDMRPALRDVIRGGNNW